MTFVKSKLKFFELENNSRKLQIISGKFQSRGEFQNNTINDTKQISLSHVINIRIPFCQSNEHYALKFITKLESFTKEKHSFVIIWKARNVRSLFNLKDNVSHVSSVVYEGKPNCGENYIGENCPNVTIR